jgi:hypothetical protein
MMPPENIEPNDLWNQITAMPRPHRLVDFPRKNEQGEPLCQVAIFVLTQGETQAATKATEAWVRKALKEESALPGANERSEGYATLFETRAALEILCRACKRPGNLKLPFFPSPEKMSEFLSVDEVGVLYHSYLIVREELGPIVSKMGQEEMDAWVEKLAVGGAADPLSFISLAARSEFMMYLARQCWNARTANSSPTTQPAAST